MVVPTSSTIGAALLQYKDGGNTGPNLHEVVPEPEQTPSQNAPLIAPQVTTSAS